MEGKTLVWFRALRASNGLSTWNEFLRVIQARFSQEWQQQEENARASHIAETMAKIQKFFQESK
jgi:hypothetical protein